MPEAEARAPDVGGLVGGRYRLEARLGEGAMGVVWRARHEALGRAFALKLLRPEVAADPASRTRFAREAEALGRLRHPHIVAVTDFGFDEAHGAPYLVMEPLEGTSLAERLDEGAPPLDEALSILRAVADAVDAAHQAGVLHRDLKPGNVELSPSPEGTVAKVLDFGLAHLAGREEAGGALPSVVARPQEPDSRLTERGMLIGTPLYVAPELIRDPRAATSASDVYAFAALAYEVLAGRPPFVGSTHEVLQAHLHQAPPLPPAGAAALPAGVWDALGRGLAKDPAGRPGRAATLVDQIESALQHAEAARSQRRRRERGAWLAVAATALTSLLALGPLRPILAALERRSVDLRFRFTAPVRPDPRIVLIALDDASGIPGVSSLADAGDVIAPVLDRALAAGARGIAIDLLLPRKWSESERFSELLLRHPDRITLAAYSGEDRSVLGIDCVAGLIAAALGPERSGALFGYVNLSEDADGVTRRARLVWHDVSGRPRPSWAAAAARHLGPPPAPPTAGSDTFWIDHRLRVEDVPRLGWNEAARLAAVQPESFRDRLVIVGIGPTASGDDLHVVPGRSAPTRRLSGLGLQALIVDTMARGYPVREVPPVTLNWLALLAVGVLAGGLLWSRRTTWVLSAAGLLAVAYGWWAWRCLDRSGMLLPLGRPISILALGLVLALGARAWNR